MKKVVFGLLLLLSLDASALDILLSWEAPTTRENGDPITVQDLSEYRVYKVYESYPAMGDVDIVVGENADLIQGNIPPESTEIVLYNVVELWGPGNIYIAMNVFDKGGIDDDGNQTEILNSVGTARMKVPVNRGLPFVAPAFSIRGVMSDPLMSIYSWLVVKSFDGIDDYVDLGVLDVPGNKLTITGWFNTNDNTNDYRIISKATSVSSADHYYMVSLYEGSLRFRLKTDGVTDTLLANNAAINNNTWYHFAIVYDGAYMTSYLDGIKVGSMPKTGDLTLNNNVRTWIGGNPPTPTDRPWDGELASIELYNQSLTDTQINMIKNSTTP